MVGAISDIQLRCLRPLVERRARTAAAIVHGHGRVTEIFYTMSNLNILWGSWYELGLLYKE